METKKEMILVPWDFTETGQFALDHAIKFAKITDSEVGLVHIVKKQKEAIEAIAKLKPLVDEVEKNYNLKLHLFIREGNIFKTITEVAEETKAIMGVMGTHGIKGMQRFTGSWALKVIVGNDCPFMVVQGPPSHDLFANIVFPVDFKKEDKQKLRWAHFLAKFFNTKVHLVTIESTDAIVVKNTKSNLIYAKNYLTTKGIENDIVTLKGKGSLADESIKYAAEINAGLILIMTTKNISLQDYVLGADEQQIIANEARIPVMCVNPRADLTKHTGFA
ncbi:MAG TPA: universal stress protein UspA [Bacteroidales bacterium]|nr:universal stress protein UspA [Bacteroidales bacterium]